MDKKLKLVKKRLTDNKITFSEKVREDFPTRIFFEIPAGREKHECIMVCREAEIDYALATNFEKYNFIQQYEAIWSKDEQTIEAEVTSQNNFYGRLHKFLNKNENLENDDNDNIPDYLTLTNFKGLEVTIRKCSPVFSFLTTSRERGLRRFNMPKITIQIKNTAKTTHDSAKELLEKISNSMFFQIDLAFELPIHLQSQRESFIERFNKRNRKNKLIDENAIISEPKYEYDTEPITLYWNAKETSSIPIFQFLAYYQTVEYYFPIYSNFDAKQKIQNIIKDPRFNANKDSDITKIINSIKSNSTKSFGNEKEQLKSTIAYSLTNHDLKDFFSADETRFNFYAENKGKNLCAQKISIKAENIDLISEVTERIYQIRCRIVHSKLSDSDEKILLPYSSEVKLLNYDIDLVEFIARKVLINSSRPLSV